MSGITDIYDHDLDVADSFASKAMDRMRHDEIPPVPQNFEVWYVYYANVNPKLRDEINHRLLEQPKISQRDCSDLYDKYLNFGQERETYQRAGDQINATLFDVTNLMQNVKDTTGHFTDTLQTATNKLSKVEVSKDIRDVLSMITEETEKMMQYNAELERRLDQSSTMMSELKRDMERIRRQAVTDGLTGLANRKAFDEQINRMCREGAKDGHIFSLVMIDIDHFKAFNDTYGHQVGDQVLRLVAMTLINEVKGQDMAARYGGEEFAIILPGTNVEAAHAVAENLRKAVEKKEVMNRTTGENLGQITISLGVAQFYETENADELIRRADVALYNSKNKGRNQVVMAPTPHDIDKKPMKKKK
ncbi:MAG: GGDEF domain-containing protein [Alphaproteobacteria bacterium]|nr:GGDEF domain-containing protein [Alphaproteobacteria bacterium]